MLEELKSVLVLGGTGATGKEVIKILVENDQVAKVKMISRRKIDLPEDCPGSNKVEQVIVDFDNLDASKDEFAQYDIAFCCLGESRKKLAQGAGEGVDTAQKLTRPKHVFSDAE